MIRITPYYKMTGNSKEILDYHMNLVADVVPFRPEDVFQDDITKVSDSSSETPRDRTNTTYIKLLKAWDIPIGGNIQEQRIHDAELAERLIGYYSETLHEKLYGNKKGPVKEGIVAYPDVLRILFAAPLPQGNLPDPIKELKPSATPNKKTINAAKLLCQHVFRYNEYSKKKNNKNNPNSKPRDIYRLLDMLNIEVCPYCNRQFISTVSYGKKRVRAQLDHFRNKEKYPFLALSLNNLIPCCAVCNLLKHNNDPDMLYPYEEGIDDYYIFHAECDKDNITSLLTGADDATQKFQINIDINEKKPQIPEYTNKINASLETLALKELYQFNKKHVAALFRQRYIYTTKLLEDHKGQFQDLFKKSQDIKYTLRLMDYSPDKWGQQPLSKLTHDISDQIDELYESNQIIQKLLSAKDID